MKNRKGLQMQQCSNNEKSSCIGLKGLRKIMENLKFTSSVRASIQTKLCRRQKGVIQNHANEHVDGIGQDEARDRKYKRLTLGGGQSYDRSSCCSIRYVR
jgi:hypothetical protein